MTYFIWEFFQGQVTALSDFSMLSAIQETLKIAGSSPRAWVRGSEKPRGVQRSVEKAGATEGIQSTEEGGSPLKLARARKDFLSHFSRSLFWEKNLLDMFWVSFGGVETYSEQKRFLGLDF